MLQNAYFLAKIGADIAENEQHFAEILRKFGNYPTDPPGRGVPRAQKAEVPARRPLACRGGRRGLSHADAGCVSFFSERELLEKSRAMFLSENACL